MGNCMYQTDSKYKIYKIVPGHGIYPNLWLCEKSKVVDIGRNCKQLTVFSLNVSPSMSLSLLPLPSLSPVSVHIFYAGWKQ